MTGVSNLPEIAMRRWAPLAAVLALAACDPDAPGGASGPAIGQDRAAIRNGTREPQVLPLSGGQKLAVGWLHPRGQPGANFCTGTLITPTLVATAAHCTRGRSARSLSFGVGLNPNDPVASFAAAGKFEHRSLDATILRLTEDVTDRVPEIVPIPANRAPLDDSIVGRDVEAAGFGETYDRSRSGLYFAVVELIRVRDTEIMVDGRGRQGICFGDSGGPVMTTDADDQPVVLAVENWGDQSCVGVDHMARLDVMADWIDDIAAGGDPGGCGEVDYQGRCVGSVAEWCDGGSIQRLDCNDRGQMCGWVDDDVGFFCQDAPPCGDVPPTGICQDNTVVRCRFGRLAHEDCSTSGRECAQDGSGAFCHAPVSGGPDSGAGPPPPARDTGVSDPDPGPDPDPAPGPDASGPDLGGADGGNRDLDGERSQSSGGCQATVGGDSRIGTSSQTILAALVIFALLFTIRSPLALIPRRRRP